MCTKENHKKPKNLLFIINTGGFLFFMQVNRYEKKRLLAMKSQFFYLVAVKAIPPLRSSHTITLTFAFFVALFLLTCYCSTLGYFSGGASTSPCPSCPFFFLFFLFFFFFFFLLLSFPTPASKYKHNTKLSSYYPSVGFSWLVV